MGLQQQYISSIIQEAIREDYPWLNNINDFGGEIAISGDNASAIMFLPQAGADPGYVLNPNQFPLSISTRTDTVKQIDLDLLTTLPIRVGLEETKFITYDKVASVLMGHRMVLMEQRAKRILYRIAPAASTLSTSGTTGTTNGPTNATNKKITTKTDVANLAKAMDMDNMPEAGRFLMLPPTMYYELFTDSDLVRSDGLGTAILPSGVLRQLMGFNIMKQVTTPVYDSSGVLLPYGQAPIGTDNLAAIAWQSAYVGKAESPVVVLEDLKKPEYLGGIYNAHLWFGAGRYRSDNKGIYALRQTA